MDAMQRRSADPLTRRGFLKLVAVSSLAAGVGIASLRRGQISLKAAPYHAWRYLMGTVVHLTLIGFSINESFEAAERAFAEMQRLIDIFDHRKPLSALARLNREGCLQNPPAELTEVISRALDICRLTGGRYDITIKPVFEALRQGRKPAPHELALVDYQRILLEQDRIRFAHPGMAVTLDSLAKGYIVERAARLLKSLGYPDLLVEAGGDLVTDGKGADEQPWQVGITHPRQNTPQDLLAIIPVMSQAVATSGDYLNHFNHDFSSHHIIDPKTADSPSELASVSVLAESALDADALSTALMVLGIEEGLKLAESLAGVGALLVRKDLSLYKTSGFPLRRW